MVEPFVKKSMTFEGVGFADLMNAAKATGTSLTVHAADDYEVTFDAAMLRSEGALLATHVDGKPIEVRSGGPVRMIFPASSKAGEDGGHARAMRFLTSGNSTAPTRRQRPRG